MKTYRDVAEVCRSGGWQKMQRELVFRGIGTPTVSVGRGEAAAWMSSERFARLLEYIAAPPAGPPMSITFDYGNASDVEIGLPELRKRRLKPRTTLRVTASRDNIAIWRTVQCWPRQALREVFCHHKARPWGSPSVGGPMYWTKKALFGCVS